MIGGLGLPTWKQCHTTSEKIDYIQFCFIVPLAVISYPFYLLYQRIRMLIGLKRTD